MAENIRRCLKSSLHLIVFFMPFWLQVTETFVLRFAYIYPYHHIHEFDFLTEYRSPDYECLGFDLIKKQLVKIGYPEELAEYNYDDRFAIR